MSTPWKTFTCTYIFFTLYVTRDQPVGQSPEPFSCCPVCPLARGQSIPTLQELECTYKIMAFMYPLTFRKILHLWPFLEEKVGGGVENESPVSPMPASWKGELSIALQETLLWETVMLWAQSSLGSHHY